MNMMTAIQAAPLRARPKLFLDENGEPSERCGPDLSQARPIEEVIEGLANRKTGPSGTYSTAFWCAAKDSGIHLSVTVLRNGEEELGMSLPFDGQEELREPRYEALRAHLNGNPKRRQSVIDLVNMLGHFADNRPFGSVEEAAEQYIAAGGRIYILPDGRCDEVMPLTERTLLEECRNGYPLRRLSHRYDATLRANGAREEMAKLVRQRGKERAGSLVLEKP